MTQECEKCHGTGLIKADKVCGYCTGRGVVEIEDAEVVEQPIEPLLSTSDQEFQENPEVPKPWYKRIL